MRHSYAKSRRNSTKGRKGKNNDTKTGLRRSGLSGNAARRWQKLKGLKKRLRKIRRRP